MTRARRNERIREIIDDVLERGRRLPPDQEERFRAAWERQKALIDPAGYRPIVILAEPGRGGFVN